MIWRGQTGVREDNPLAGLGSIVAAAGDSFRDAEGCRNGREGCDESWHLWMFMGPQDEKILDNWKNVATGILVALRGDALPGEMHTSCTTILILRLH